MHCFSYTTVLLRRANTECKVVQGLVPLVSCSFTIKFQVDAATAFKIDCKA